MEKSTLLSDPLWPLRFNRVTDFLQAYYRAKKQSQTSWSYQGWANKLKQNKGLLVRIVAGKRPISTDLENSLCRYFSFEKELEKYFRLLVSYDRIQRIEPDLEVNLPQLEVIKKRITKVSANKIKNEDINFLGNPEVEWLLAFFKDGPLAVDQETIQKAMHKGLSHIDFKALYLEALRLGLLSSSNGKTHSSFDQSLYLDSELTGDSFAKNRKTQVLKLIAKMTENDYEKGSTPTQINNLSVCFRMREDDVRRLNMAMQKCLREQQKIYEDARGGSLVDLQFFFCKVASTD